MTAAIPEVIAFAESPDIAARRRALSERVRPHDVENFTRAFMDL
jgi:hypothetical protein